MNFVFAKQCEYVNDSHYIVQKKHLLKIVFDSAKKIEDLNVIIENEKIERYISYLTDDLTKDNFVSFQENIEGEVKNVKSIKIVMQTIEGEIYYHVKYNNPLSE